MTDQTVVTLAALSALCAVLAVLLAMVAVACLVRGPGSGWESPAMPVRLRVADRAEKPPTVLPGAFTGRVHFPAVSTVHTPLAGQEQA